MPPADPDPAVQVGGLAAGCLDLHVVADLLAEEVPVIGDEDDRLHAEFAPGCVPPAEGR